ncbi:MAG: hypothetical protein ABI155_10475 [Paralcaligenes sp.]
MNVIHFEWDETKSDACLAQRGFDFAYVLPVFLDANRITLEDTRWDYGEDLARPTAERSNIMKIVRVKINTGNLDAFPEGRVDELRLDHRRPLPVVFPALAA